MVVYDRLKLVAQKSQRWIRLQRSAVTHVNTSSTCVTERPACFSLLCWYAATCVVNSNREKQLQAEELNHSLLLKWLFQGHASFQQVQLSSCSLEKFFSSLCGSFQHIHTHRYTTVHALTEKTLIPQWDSDLRPQALLYLHLHSALSPAECVRHIKRVKGRQLCCPDPTVCHIHTSSLVFFFW